MDNRDVKQLLKEVAEGGMVDFDKILRRYLEENPGCSYAGARSIVSRDINRAIASKKNKENLEATKAMHQAMYQQAQRMRETNESARLIQPDRSRVNQIEQG